MSAINTSYKTNLSHWEACAVEHLMGLIHEIMLNQIDSPVLLHYRLNDFGSIVQELVVEFNDDRAADITLMNEQK